MAFAKQEKRSASPKSIEAEKPKVEFKSSGFFVMRAPLLPFGEFLNWSSGLESASDGSVATAESLNADRAKLREGLRALVAQPEIQDALFVASPDLHDYLDQWMTDPDGKRGARVEGALVRYFSRMCGRSTPFGLFAATSLGKIGETTQLTIAGKSHCQRHTRLDMDYLFALVDELGRNTEVRGSLVYRPNSSLYVAAGRIRYVESRVDGRARTYHLVAVENSECIATILQRAGAGATIAELAAALVDDEVAPFVDNEAALSDDDRITMDDATQFIGQLIDHQILVSDLALPVTGAEPIHPLIERLRSLTGSQNVAEVLEQVRNDLIMMDAAGMGALPEAYRAIASRLESLPAKAELQRLFQVDMVRPANESSLGESVIAEISAGIALLQSIFAKPYESELSRFRSAFAERYEDREIPLVEVLDDDLGLGFPVGSSAQGNVPLLRGLALPSKGEWQSAWQARDAFLLRKLSEALTTGATKIELREQDIEALRAKETLLFPDAINVMCRIAAESEEAIEQGNFHILIEGAGGPSGVTLLGRFCHADADLHREVEQHLRAEESLRPDAVFAELVHLPEGRIGNVLARPVLRGYEIPYLGHSGANHEHQLPVTDLLVSVREDRIVLRSAKLGCEVIPRLTSAHNWTRESSTVYRFLGDLQSQGTMPGVAWNWGALESAPFLPRVVAGRLVLSRAQWALSKEELQRITEVQGVERFRLVQQWRAERKLPRFVVLADGDNTLPVDLENVLSVDSFAHIVKDRSEVRLQELWPEPDQLCARDVEGAGRYVHELIVPFVKNGGMDKEVEMKSSHLAVSSSLYLPAARSFPPGSEWLYAKIYCGTATADQLIREVIKSVADEVIASGAADQWFFLRYLDPAWHLRVRFHGQPERLREEVWPKLQAALAEMSPRLGTGGVWRIQLDTYEREVERYGGATGIELSEQLFYADSQAVTEIIDLLEQDDVSADETWRLTLYGMDRMLDDFGFDLAGKAEILKAARTGFLAEFKADENLLDQLGERYRKERKALELLLDRTKQPENNLAAGLEVFDRRSVHLRPIVEALRAAEQERTLSKPLAEMASSYLHMHANRMLRSAHRAQELVIYDLLTRLYSSQLARQRQSRPDSAARRAA
ncbi:MAG: lantibiotic dehydratase [Blastocatellia bacterium]